MPYIAHDIEHKRLGSAIGSGECVALVQAWAHAPNTGSWSKGIQVKGNDHLISKGTAIATFVDGTYHNAHGNHAAIYIGQSSEGIQVIDQWQGHAASRRTIRWDAVGHSLSDNGNAFSVIE
ncbi:MAG: BPSL0067 family protein [Polyangiaceae bacterium]